MQGESISQKIAGYVLMSALCAGTISTCYTIIRQSIDEAKADRCIVRKHPKIPTQRQLCAFSDDEGNIDHIVEHYGIFGAKMVLPVRKVYHREEKGFKELRNIMEE